ERPAEPDRRPGEATTRLLVPPAAQSARVDGATRVLTSELAGRPAPAVEPARERVEGGDEALLRRRCAGARLRRQHEARVLRYRATGLRLRDREEAVAVVPVGFDRLLQRLLQERDGVVSLPRWSLQDAELAEDALAVVGDAGDSLSRLV